MHFYTQVDFEVRLDARNWCKDLTVPDSYLRLEVSSDCLRYNTYSDGREVH